MTSEETGSEQIGAVEEGGDAQATQAGQGTAESQNAVAVPDRPFSPDEISQFAADDVGAGGAIGKMLAILFIYTVIVMAYVGWATWAKAWPLY